MLNRTQSTELPETKRKLVDAGMNLMRERGFNATTVDEICAAAGVTKGGFFHYFKSKDDIAKAALASFHEVKLKAYADAPFRKLANPLDRVFIGVFAQELAFTNPELRSACLSYLSKIAEDFGKDLAEAKAAYAPHASFDPKRLAMLYVSIVQGSLILAKVAEDSDAVEANIEQFRSYLRTLFGLDNPLAPEPSATVTSQRLN